MDNIKEAGALLVNPLFYLALAALFTPFAKADFHSVESIITALAGAAGGLGMLFLNPPKPKADPA